MTNTAFMDPHVWERAAAAIHSAHALLITAGAGMGVDSGLPDFRGRDGFWRAYPPYQQRGLAFEDLANPAWFEKDPALAWGFYGHRSQLYRNTFPHPGFEVLLRWAREKSGGAAVFTSNVDGQFQRAGFPPELIHEVHGSLEYAQCLNPACPSGVIPLPAQPVAVDAVTFCAVGALPRCALCDALLRPNVLMFGDWGWNPSRTQAQQARLGRWLTGLRQRSATLVVVECGAGEAVPTVRRFSESTALAHHGTLVRINPRDDHVPHGAVALRCGAAAGLARLDALEKGLQDLDDIFAVPAAQTAE